MSIAVALTDSRAGRHALTAAVAEATGLGTSVLLINLTLHDYESTLDHGVEIDVVDRNGRGDRDPVVAVLDELRVHPEVTRLVVGVRSRSRMGDLALGSVSQRLILRSPVPVLAVRHDQELPAG